MNYKETYQEWLSNPYFDEDGNEITINQGKTWVCVVYDTKEDQIVIE